MSNIIKKRKLVVVTVQEKLTAIKRFHKGKSLKSVAKDYGYPNRKKIDRKLNNGVVYQHPQHQSQNSMKQGEYNKIDETLCLWFTQQRDRGISISGLILQQKAIEIGENLLVTEASDDTFIASDGWLSRQKNRHDVR